MDSILKWYLIIRYEYNSYDTLWVCDNFSFQSLSKRQQQNNQYSIEAATCGKKAYPQNPHSHRSFNWWKYWKHLKRQPIGSLCRNSAHRPSPTKHIRTRRPLWHTTLSHSIFVAQRQHTTFCPPFFWSTKKHHFQTFDTTHGC